MPIHESDIDKITAFKKTCSPTALWQGLRGRGISVMDEEEDAYPQRLLSIPDKPALLYELRGENYVNCSYVNRSGADETSGAYFERPSLAVIGSRICSEYGRMIAKRTGKLCAQAGIELVSGMAVGIDGIAQRAAIDAGGMVTAVLGSGVDVCYPNENRDLYAQLRKNGRILSEYTPGTQPVPGNFPPRNRIISGLSDAVLVVEAKEQSGTMITVDMALEQGRQVYIIPGRLTDPLSAGCNRLIAQGAEIVWNLGEVIDLIAREDEGRTFHVTGESGLENGALRGGYGVAEPAFTGSKATVWEVLDYAPLSVQQIYERICTKSEITYADLQRILLDLELSGYVSPCGGRFARKG